MALFFFSGVLIYVTVLLTNAIAILSEDRFLARSELHFHILVIDVLQNIQTSSIVGWSSTQLPSGYDQNGYGGEQAGDSIKARLILLVSAVRTLLRGELCVTLNTYILFSQPC